MENINEFIGLPEIENSRIIDTCKAVLAAAGQMDSTEEDIRRYIECDYLTAHEGTDGKYYIWYLDSDGNTGAVRVEDGAEVTVDELAEQGVHGAEKENPGEGWEILEDDHADRE